MEDNGPGIPKESREHVFEMFYSGKNKVSDSRRSLGLGLALCRSIVNAHGGYPSPFTRVVVAYGSRVPVF